MIASVDLLSFVVKVLLDSKDTHGWLLWDHVILAKTSFDLKTVMDALFEEWACVLVYGLFGVDVLGYLAFLKHLILDFRQIGLVFDQIIRDLRLLQDLRLGQIKCLCRLFRLISMQIMCTVRVMKTKLSLSTGHGDIHLRRGLLHHCQVRHVKFKPG